MKNITRVLCLFLFTLFFTNLSYSQLGPGDIAFLSWASDSSSPGGENFSFIALADIPAGTAIFFDDEEQTGGTFLTTGSEGNIRWENTTGGTIAAGTVITLSSPSSNDSTAPSANFGTITEPNGGFNLATGDGMLAYVGTDRSPTAFLAAIGDASVASGIQDLSGTGLTLGTHAVNTGG